MQKYIVSVTLIRFGFLFVYKIFLGTEREGKVVWAFSNKCTVLYCSVSTYYLGYYRTRSSI